MQQHISTSSNSVAASPVPIIRSKSDGSGSIMQSSTTNNLHFSSSKKTAKAITPVQTSSKKSKRQGFLLMIKQHPLKFFIVTLFLVIPLVQILAFSGNYGETNHIASVLELIPITKKATTTVSKDFDLNIHSSLRSDVGVKLPTIPVIPTIPDPPLKISAEPPRLTLPSVEMVKLPSVPDLPSIPHKPKSALIFTMDSIDSYIANSKHGGPGGEIVIRESLQHAFDLLNVRYDVVKSDQELGTKDFKQYDYFILDPWTWAAKGWVPKPFLVEQENKLYILDFFGSEKLKGSTNFQIPPSRFLTAFGVAFKSNSFLGYYIPPVPSNQIVVKKNQGIIWGKSAKYLSGHIDFLKHIAEVVELHSTCSTPVFQHQNVIWHGSLSRSAWRELLLESKFLIGLGDPLLGPSAIDAIAFGNVYINPIYKNPMKSTAGDKIQSFSSQHPYAETKLGSPFVCSYKEDSIYEALACVKFALSVESPPIVPTDFTEEQYLKRVKSIFML